MAIKNVALFHFFASPHNATLIGVSMRKSETAPCTIVAAIAL
jgi:hypothetical protein